MGVTITRTLRDGTVQVRKGPTGEDYRAQQEAEAAAKVPPPQEAAMGVVVAPHHIWSAPNAQGTAVLLYPTGSEIPEDEARRLGLIPEQKKERALEDKKARRKKE